MKPAKIRLLVATLLLVGWLSWLGYLAWTKTNPVVLSRSQIMASTHFVLAEVSIDRETGHPEPTVKLKEDLRPVGEPLPAQIRVRNIKEGRLAGKPDRFEEKATYLLMLTQSDGVYELTPPPRAPGHENPMRPRPWVYRWEDAGVKEQFESLVPKR
jgi:hypothetical protein